MRNIPPLVIAFFAYAYPACTSSQPADAHVEPTPSSFAIGPTGGTVDRLHFAVFGDVRPASPDDPSHYPVAVIHAVMKGIGDLGAQFAVGTGDYFFSLQPASIAPQIDALLSAEAIFGRPVFHALGNHECDSATAGNCTSIDQTANISAFHARLAPAYANPCYDFIVQTSLGSAHFVVTAPNAWTSAQESWLAAALDAPARYTFVVAHEPPDITRAPGTVPIESQLRAHAGTVTLRFHGHTHEYRHAGPNEVISGNAGAPLSGAASAYGFVLVDQNDDATLTVTAYDIGDPPMAVDSFSVWPDGTPL